MDRTVRAKFAAQLLDNPLFEMVCEELDTEYHARWASSVSTTVREEVWNERQAFQRVISAFKSASRGDGRPIEEGQIP